MNQKEIYISVDIEVDGPIPGPHSMLSIGAAAFSTDGKLIDTFSLNLKKLPRAKGHPKNMAWWATQPAAWAACRIQPQPIKKSMQQLVDWLKQLAGKTVFVGYPAAFDFMFVYWYLMKFVGESPFEHSAIDIRTYAMSLLGKSYHLSGKANMPERWLEAPSLSHVAVEDAIKQGNMFCKMLLERNNLK